MITMTLSFNSYEEAIDALRGIKAGNVINVAPLAPAAEAKPQADAAISKAKEAAAQAPKPEKAAPTPVAQTTATTQPAPAQSEAAAESPSELTYDQVAKVVLQVSKEKGRPVAQAIFKTFDLTGLPSAKPEQFAAIKAAFEEALA